MEQDAEDRGHGHGGRGVPAGEGQLTEMCPVDELLEHRVVQERGHTRPAPARPGFAGRPSATASSGVASPPSLPGRQNATIPASTHRMQCALRPQPASPRAREPLLAVIRTIGQLTRKLFLSRRLFARIARILYVVRKAFAMSRPVEDGAGTWGYRRGV